MPPRATILHRRDFFDARKNLITRLKAPNKFTVLGRPRGVRGESTESGEDSSGHISASPNEGILFIDSESCSISLRVATEPKRPDKMEQAFFP